MNAQVEEALTVAGFVAFVYVWLRVASALAALPLEWLPDPLAALLAPLWLLLPFLLAGAYYHLRPDEDTGAGTGAP